MKKEKRPMATVLDPPAVTLAPVEERERLGDGVDVHVGDDVQPLGRVDREYLIRMGHYLEARDAFRSDAALARALGVHRSRVARWKAGDEPEEKNARLLRDLATVVSALKPVYDARVIAGWLDSPRLEGRTPLDLLHDGNLPEVLHLVSAASTGAYV